VRHLVDALVEAAARLVESQVQGRNQRSPQPAVAGEFAFPSSTADREKRTNRARPKPCMSHESTMR